MLPKNPASVSMSNQMRCHSLTNAQKRVWYQEEMYPDTPMHNLGGAVRINGEIDLTVLEKAINLFIWNNEGVRIQLNENQGEIGQYISEHAFIKLPCLDFSESVNAKGNFSSWSEEVLREPFTLLGSPLFRFSLFKVCDGIFGYLIVFHHIICDGWSIYLATNRIKEYYEQLKSSGIDSVHCVVNSGLGRFNYESERKANSYVQFIDSEREYLASSKYENDRAYWVSTYQDTDITSFYRAQKYAQGRRKAFTLDAQLAAQIHLLISDNGFSMNVFLLSVICVYLHKIRLTSDVIFGIPVLGRTGKKERSIFGMCTSTLPFGLSIAPEQPMEKVFNEVQKRVKRSLAHQRYPYNHLVQDLEVLKSGYSSMFDVSVNYYNTKLDQEFAGHKVENEEYYNGFQAYPLQIVLKEWGDKLTLFFDYQIDSYDTEEIDCAYMRIIALIQSIIDGGKTGIARTKVVDIETLTEDERNFSIYDFNCTRSAFPRDKSISCQFEEQVARSPNAIAVYCRNEKYTYSELNKEVNKLARGIIKKGKGPGDVVGVCMMHSIDVLIVILGAIKAGCAYLPIDLSLPISRIRYILNDCGCELVLSHAKVLEDVDLPNALSGQFQVEDFTGLCETNDENLGEKIAADNTIYIIYTSGSTGNPKGVEVSHRNLSNYVCWGKKHFLKSEEDAFALYSSLGFDLTVTSIFVPLLSGVAVHIYPESDEVFVFEEMLRDNRVSVIKLTPSHLALLESLPLSDIPEEEIRLKRLIVGGENLSTRLSKSIAEKFNNQVEIINEYGPTEATVGCMIYRYNVEKDTQPFVPIGRPADNTQIYLLDNNLKPVPKGVPGEIYISGEGVAKGYVNKTEETLARFVANPFVDGLRMYKTGDLARSLYADDLEFIGRIDSQVKVNGYRIELGEIESLVNRSEFTCESVVIIKTIDDKNFISCYYTTEIPDAELKLKEYLIERLPHYMVPSLYVCVERIPLTTNGKVDKSALLAPEISGQPVEDDRVEEPLNADYREVKSVFAQVLDVTDYKPNDNYYQMGGDSVKAIQIVSRLKTLGLECKVKDVVWHPRFLDFYNTLKKANQETEIADRDVSGFIESTPIVSWFYGQAFPHPEYFNQSILLRCKRPLSRIKLEKAFHQLICHHDSLRINYCPEEKKLYYNNQHRENPFVIETYDLSLEDVSSREQEIYKQCLAVSKGMSLEDSLLIRCCLLRLNNEEVKLFIVAHHLIIDGVSWRILIDDLILQYGQLEDEQEPARLSKSTTYQQWAQQSAAYQNAVLSDEEGCGIVSNFVFNSDVATAYALEKDVVVECLEQNNIFRNPAYTFQLDKEHTELIRFSANDAYSTRPDELLLIGIIFAASKFSKTDLISLELENHGRDIDGRDMDLSRTIGWFTEMSRVEVTLREKITNDASLKDDESERRYIETVKSVKEQIRQRVKPLASSTGIPESRHISRSMIRFNFLGNLNSLSNELFDFEMPDLRINKHDENRTSTFIDINAYIIDGVLVCRFDCASEDFSGQGNILAVFVKEVAHQVISLVEHCVGKKDKEFTPSDFEEVNISQDELDGLFV